MTNNSIEICYDDIISRKLEKKNLIFQNICKIDLIYF